MPEPQVKVRYDPTVNLGHILTFLGFMITGLLVWGKMDTRVTLVEERVGVMERASSTAREEQKQANTLIQSDLRLIQQAVNDLRVTQARGDRR